MNAIQRCIEFEKILNTVGFHIGLTGSALYGEPGEPPKDLDIIIYPHINDDGNHSIMSPPEVLALLGITDIEHTESDTWYGNGHVDYIYKGKLNGENVDAFFLE